MMNSELKEKFRVAGVKQWEIAAELGVSEQTLIRWLRFPLSEDRKQKILDAIEKLSGKGA